MANSENFNIFGTPIMQGYYVVFDVDNHQVGFGPNLESNKTTLIAGDTLLGILEQETPMSNLASILLLTAIAIVLAFVWGYFVIPAMGNLFVQIFTTMLFATTVVVGEYFMYVWFVTENIFGFAKGQGDSFKYALMIAYALVVGALWRAVMRSIERSK